MTDPFRRLVAPLCAGCGLLAACGAPETETAGSTHSALTVPTDAAPAPGTQQDFYGFCAVSSTPLSAHGYSTAAVTAGEVGNMFQNRPENFLIWLHVQNDHSGPCTVHYYPRNWFNPPQYTVDFTRTVFNPHDAICQADGRHFLSVYAQVCCAGYNTALYPGGCKAYDSLLQFGLDRPPGPTEATLRQRAKDDAMRRARAAMDSDANVAAARRACEADGKHTFHQTPPKIVSVSCQLPTPAKPSMYCDAMGCNAVAKIDYGCCPTVDGPFGLLDGVAEWPGNVVVEWVCRGSPDPVCYWTRVILNPLLR
jgi:hypothetical protein